MLRIRHDPAAECSSLGMPVPSLPGRLPCGKHTQKVTGDARCRGRGSVQFRLRIWLNRNLYRVHVAMHACSARVSPGRPVHHGKAIPYGPWDLYVSQNPFVAGVAARATLNAWSPVQPTVFCPGDRGTAVLSLSLLLRSFTHTYG